MKNEPRPKLPSPSYCRMKNEHKPRLPLPSYCRMKNEHNHRLPSPNYCRMRNEHKPNQPLPSYCRMKNKHKVTAWYVTACTPRPMYSLYTAATLHKTPFTADKASLVAESAQVLVTPTNFLSEPLIVAEPTAGNSPIAERKLESEINVEKEYEDNFEK